MNELNEDEMLQTEGGATYSDCTMIRKTDNKVVFIFGSNSNKGSVTIKIIRAWSNGLCTEAGGYMLTNGKKHVLNVMGRDKKTHKITFILKNNQLEVIREDANVTAFKIKPYITTASNGISESLNKGVGEIHYKFTI